MLYAFGGGADGAFPQLTTLVLDSEGNLYGTTPIGGTGKDCSGGCGVVFKVDQAGHETVLYSFIGNNDNNEDGANPYAGLFRDAAGNLYGTTLRGGTFSDGTIFKVDSAGAETVLHAFDSSDGALPHAAVLRDAKGNLYGTTSDGGEFDFGTVFKLTP